MKESVQLCVRAVCGRMRLASACPSRCYSRTCSFVDENGKLHLPFLSSGEWTSVQTMKCIAQMLLEVRPKTLTLWPSLLVCRTWDTTSSRSSSREDTSLPQYVGGVIIFVYIKHWSIHMSALHQNSYSAALRTTSLDIVMHVMALIDGGNIKLWCVPSNRSIRG